MITPILAETSCYQRESFKLTKKKSWGPFTIKETEEDLAFETEKDKITFRVTKTTLKYVLSHSKQNSPRKKIFSTIL